MYCVAPYEADSQIAFMVASGLADFAITDDSDCLPIVALIQFSN